MSADLEKGVLKAVIINLHFKNAYNFDEICML